MKNPMTRIDIEELQRIFARLREINAVPFKEIVWLREGKPVVLRPEQLEDYEFTGLSNTAFVDLQLYDEDKWE